MEISGPEYELLNVKRDENGLHHLVRDTVAKCYLYITRKSGVQVWYEYAGCNEADAMAGFPDYITERRA